jgi:hypothetical protein
MGLIVARRNVDQRFRADALDGFLRSRQEHGMHFGAVPLLAKLEAERRKHRQQRRDLALRRRFSLMASDRTSRNCRGPWRSLALGRGNLASPVRVGERAVMLLL